MRRVLIICCLLLLPFSQSSLQHVNGQILASASFDPLPVVYVDFGYTGDESGTEEEPFNSLDEALVVVEDAGTIFLAPGATNETTSEVSKNVTLQIWNIARQFLSATSLHVART